MKRASIYDVAERAGVAPSTVSRAFGVPGRVTDATRERVFAAAEELGYRPAPRQQRSPAATALPRGRTVAMLVSDITNPHYFELIRGAELRARAAGATLVLVNCEESAQIELQQVHGLQGSVDGFVLASSRLPDQQLRDLAAQQPVVLLNRDLDGLTSVTFDMASGCRQILEHLASLGHQALTYCAGPPSSWMGSARWRTLSEGAADVGMEATRLGPYTPTVANGSSAADAALRVGSTAIVAHNDLLAIGIMRRLADRGIRVPDDISVIGFDDIFAATLTHPMLTTLGGPISDAGRRAVELLTQAIELRSTGATQVPEQVAMPAELVVRTSSGPAPTAAGRVPDDAP